MKIFISSTYEDLKDERKQAIDTISTMAQPIAMEKWPASNKSAKEMALTQLSGSDAVILILGFKYGSMDDDGISITEIEYNTAKFLKLPVFVFLKCHPDGKWRSKEGNEEILEKINAFKARLDSDIEENYRRTFETPEQLDGEITKAIRKYEIEHGIIGVKISAFESYEDFSSPFLDRSKIFNHSYSLVGRQEFLSYLDNFMVSSKEIAVIYGRGGIGKSKILLEFGRNFENKYPDWKIRFLKESIELSEESIRQLPAKKCLIIVDDAHRRTDIGLLLALINKYQDRFKIVLSSRSYGLNYINTKLSLAGFDSSEIEVMPEVEELKLSDLKKLGIEVLGSDHEQFLEPLINVAKDSTLVLVVGGKLVAKNEIDPNLLERNSEFHRVVFDKFQEVITGDIDDKLDKELSKNILSLISVLSPIHPEKTEFKKSASKFLKIEESKLIRSIGILEESGILLRRGYSLRITPDVLSDHILFDSCIAFNGQSTGYAKRIFDEFWSTFPKNILLNLSELDWRVKSENESMNLLDEFWNIIENEFKNGSHSKRAEILKYMDQVAYRQPDRVLELIEYAIRNPFKGEDDVKLPRGYEYTQQSVLSVLPNLLKQIAYNLDYLPRCCDILWKLGKNEKYRPPNFGPAMTSLRDLAKYEVNESLIFKPFIYSAKVLERVEGWFEDPNIDNYFNSPLDIIDKLLAKEGVSTFFKSHTLLSQPFVVPYEKTKFIREKALNLVERYAKSDSTKIVLRAIKSLIMALRPPYGYYNRKVSDDELNQWLPEQLKILEIIEDFVKNTKDPIVHIQIVSDLKFYSKYPRQKEIAIKSSLIIKLIPNSFDIQVNRAIWSNYDGFYDDIEDYHRADELIKNNKKEVIKELLKNIDNEMDLFKFLNQILTNFQECKIRVNAEGFFELLSRVNYELSVKLCEIIIANPCPLSLYMGSLLSEIKEKNRSEAINLVRLSLDTDDKELLYSIARGYNGKKLGFMIGNDEIGLIEKLVNYPDKNIKKQAIESLRRFSDENKVIQLALDIDIGSDEELADSICLVFDPDLGISPENLRDKDLKTIISKFLMIQELNDRLYHLDKFIGYCSSRIPESVIDFLLKRLEIYKQKCEEGDFSYKPIPFRFENGLNISSSPEYIQILRKVRNNVLNPKIPNYLVSDIFVEISNDFSRSSIKVLDEWIDSNDAEKIKAVSLLIRDAPVEFLFSNSEFISRLIEKSYITNEDCYKSVLVNCFSVTSTLDISRTPGVPPLGVVLIRDKSLELSKKFNKGSPTEKFYSSLKEDADNIIKQGLAIDEEELDEI